MSLSDAIADRLEQARRDLLDLTARNRLLNTPRRSTRSSRLEITDERSDEVYRRLVLDRKAMWFVPAPEGDSEDATGGEELPQPEENGSETAARHTDDRLQTTLSSEALQKRLLKLYYEARLFEEEQGVNILYLALGFLKWFEPGVDRERYAPLLLVPVTLDRNSANSRFRVRYSDEEITTNLSLQARLKGDFGIELPEVAEVEDLLPGEYFARVEQAISGQAGWQILPDDMVLWFFSFSRFLMYRDLQPENWPERLTLVDHPLIGGLLGEGFAAEPPLAADQQSIDPLLDPAEMVHVLDADSSQSLVIEEVRRGRSLVVQGPPGTGKSQTIANAIAAAVHQGKSVLFVAEKMAALEVVKRRLDAIGLGDACLELHSHKANKRAVLEQLAATLTLGTPTVNEVSTLVSELRETRDRLNRHVQILHQPIRSSGRNLYDILGVLVRLKQTGLKPIDVTLPAALEWSADEVRRLRNLLADVTQHLREVGQPHEHAWRGLQWQSALPMDIDRLLQAADKARRAVAELQVRARQIADSLSLEPPDTLAECSRLSRLLEQLASAPEMDLASITSSAWNQDREPISALVQAGQTLARCREQLRGVLLDLAWTTDVAPTRRDLAAYGTSWLRIFSGAYRRAKATLRGIATDRLPRSLEERLRLLDTLLQGQKALAYVEAPERQQLGRTAFGGLWRGADSNWDKLHAIESWDRATAQADVAPNYRECLARYRQQPELASQATDLRQALAAVQNQLDDVIQQAQLDLSTAFGEEQVEQLSLDAVEQRWTAWNQQREGASKWVNFYQRLRQLDQEGLNSFARFMLAGKIAAQELVDQFDWAYCEALVREAYREHPQLAQFDGGSQEQLIARFSELDRKRIQLARQEVAQAHHRNIPTGGSDVGEMGVIRHEIRKKRRHLPLRQLLQRAGRAIQRIKPVFMMSPISVAQYLEPGGLEFDLLLIDEASQVRPVDALGAIARARQIVVVGDDKQLPPTRFFTREMGEEDRFEEDEQFQARDLESILELCAAQNLSQRMLEWHYRSRHHSLIAVSNREFYGGRLNVAPSPCSQSGWLGVHFRHVPDGVFDRGRSATNRREARLVAEAVLQYARQHPDKSLGVGAFSVSQRDAILEELERLRRQDPSLEPFFATAGAEPFFVKNLENIQGDERDVILISVGYARDESGTLSMFFGPLSYEGGERRLNVLITRARERCEVFSSLMAADIDLNRATGRGAQVLRTFLEYAQTGQLHTTEQSATVAREEFVSELMRALERHGYAVHPKVGIAGLYLDVAVLDPETPGRYLLGIECDGTGYRQARSARDRNRLRGELLASRNWNLHRIWIQDWFHRPEEQLQRVLKAIEDAQNGRTSASCQATVAELASPTTQAPAAIERAAAEGARDDAASPSVPYEEAELGASPSEDLVDCPLAKLLAIVTQIVQIEGPIHQDEVIRRVVEHWGHSRTGKRMTEAIERALDEGVYQGKLEQDGLFFMIKGTSEIRVRDRSQVRSAGLRRPEMLPPQEIRQALRLVVQTHLGVTRDEAAVEASRLLGFAVTQASLRDTIAAEVDGLLESGGLEERDERLYPGATSESEPVEERPTKAR